MNSYEQFIQALYIFKLYEAGEFVLEGAQDVIWACRVPPSEMDERDVQRLDKLTWIWDVERKRWFIYT